MKSSDVIGEFGVEGGRCDRGTRRDGTLTVSVELTSRCDVCHEIKKGKDHPRTGHEGPEGEYKYSSTLSLTSALDGGGL